MGNHVIRDGAPLLPDLCSVRVLIFVILTTELIVLAFSLAGNLSVKDYWTDLGLRSLYGQWLALGTAALLCVNRRWLILRFGPTGQSVAALLAVMVVSLCLSEAAYRLMGLREHHLLFLLRGLGVALIVSGLLLRYLYVQYLQRRQAAMEAEARFQALQSRIRPHFLFNSMNTIAGLTRTRPEMAEKVVEDLSDLFRASLSEANTLSTLGDELKLAKGYLNIEGLRLGDRLRVEWSIDGLPEQAPLPRLTLQPLLENAVYHGIEKRATGGRIVIQGECSDDRVTLRLSNPAAVTNSAGFANIREGHGMALDNVRQRLRGVFGDRVSLTATTVADQYQLVLEFPITNR